MIAVTSHHCEFSVRRREGSAVQVQMRPVKSSLVIFITRRKAFGLWEGGVGFNYLFSGFGETKSHRTSIYLVCVNMIFSNYSLHINSSFPRNLAGGHKYLVQTTTKTGKSVSSLDGRGVKNGPRCTCNELPRVLVTHYVLT